MSSYLGLFLFPLLVSPLTILIPFTLSASKLPSTLTIPRSTLYLDTSTFAKLILCSFAGVRTSATSVPSRWISEEAIEPRETMVERD